jgi:hypothetical protein
MNSPAYIWRTIAIVAISISIILLIACVSLIGLLLTKGSPRSINDERLYGAWQSDREKTMAELQKLDPGKKYTDEFASIFGKLKVTYSASHIAIDMNGDTDKVSYEVLGKDKHTAVIREGASKFSQPDGREYTVINYDGIDSYWVDGGAANIHEYFKRIK